MKYDSYFMSGKTEVKDRLFSHWASLLLYLKTTYKTQVKPLFELNKSYEIIKNYHLYSPG